MKPALGYILLLLIVNEKFMSCRQMPLEVRKREIEYNFNPFIAVLHISLMNAG
jgi:hypothetical protein